jgi:peptidylprolyl isomerase
MTRPTSLAAILAAFTMIGGSTVASAKAMHHAAPAQSKLITITAKDGLKYQDIVVGKGPMPKAGQTVTVDYVGKLTNGTVFDASKNHGGTFSFLIGEGQVIPGWDQGVMTMHVGGDRKLIIPPSLGYGPEGIPGGPIPPNATLIFDVKLISVH